MFPITQICRADTGEAIDLEISLPEELATLAFAVNNGDLSGRKDVTVRLTADIDLTGSGGFPSGSGILSSPGVFDGCGHTVRGVTLQKDGPGNYGLFGAVSGTVQNLTVAGEIRNVTGDPYSAVGGIVGELSGGVVKNCAAEFTVDGGGEPLGLFAGGVAGAAEKGLLQNCRSSARMEHVRGHYLYLGGVAGCLRGQPGGGLRLCPLPYRPGRRGTDPSMPGTWLGASRENPPWSTASTGSGWIAPSGNWENGGNAYDDE